MSPAAIFGVRQFAQIDNRPSESSSAVSADTVCNAGQNCHPTLSNVTKLCLVFNFLELKKLKYLEGVNTTFQNAVWYQWKSRCQDYFPGTELDSVLPESFLSCKACLHFMIKNIFDERVYERHIGNVESASKASQLAKANFLKKWNQPDPCDPTKTIGSEYVLMYIPEYIIINQSGVSLSKADDPSDPQAPRLIRTDLSPGAQSEKTTLKVAVTLNNIIELFKHPKTGNPSTCSLWKPILEQHGNKRIPAGWVCMRRNVIGKNLSFNQQQALAKEKGVELSELLPRILFNFLAHARSEKVGAYPDGQAPWTFARTSTLTSDSGGTNRSSGCGGGSLFGLSVHNARLGCDSIVGVAVALPAEVQAIGADHLELVSGT